LKKVCFVVSHLGSGSGGLVASLNCNPRCEIRESNARYDGAASVRWLFRMGHKCRDAGAVYGDHLLYNASISNKRLYGLFRMLFVIRPARHSLNEIIKRGYNEQGASSYYRFRLRRICEMAKRCPGAVLMTWDDLAKQQSMDIIGDYLGFSTPSDPPNLTYPEREVCSEGVVDECQRAYDRYYFYLNGLNLRRSNEQVG